MKPDLTLVPLEFLTDGSYRSVLVNPGIKGAARQKLVEEHETGNAQLKTYLRGPGKVLRSKSPDMIRQEIWGYLLTRYAISALICTAATAAGSTTRRPFPPDQRKHALGQVIAEITSPRHLNTRRERTCPRALKLANPVLTRGKIGAAA